MHRTTLLISEELRQRAIARARVEKLSFGEFVRRAIERSLAHAHGDPFWNDHAIYSGEVPADYSANHDEYLYGESL